MPGNKEKQRLQADANRCKKSITNFKTTSSSENQFSNAEFLRPTPEFETEQIAEHSERIITTLKNFSVEARITAIDFGPSVSRYELLLDIGNPSSYITPLRDDIALALGVCSVRLEYPIRDKPLVRIEVPNSRPRPVLFSDLVKSHCFSDGGNRLNLLIGIKIGGHPLLVDLTEIHHLLIAGSRGSGVTTFINTIIASILHQAEACRVKLMLDSETTGVSSFSAIPCIMSPVIITPPKGLAALLMAVEEMTRRYEIPARCGVKGISRFNSELSRLKTEIDSRLDTMPRIVIIIHELAHLMRIESKFVEGSICRIAQMGHAVGIHLIIATHCLSSNVLTGLIKANLPSRVAFAVSTCNESRVILDMKGAELLLGKGDLLFVDKGCKRPLRLQSALISDAELQAVKQLIRARENIQERES